MPLHAALASQVIRVSVKAKPVWLVTYRGTPQGVFPTEWRARYFMSHHQGPVPDQPYIDNYMAASASEQDRHDLAVRTYYSLLADMSQWKIERVDYYG